MERFGILDDAYALCMAGKQTLSSLGKQTLPSLLSLMAACREGLDYTVLSLVVTISSRIVNVVAVAVPELLNDIKQYSINLLQFSAEYELGRQPANTKLSSNKTVRRVRARGGNVKWRALRLDTGDNSWGSEAVTRKTIILDVVYNASNNELVRT